MSLVFLTILLNIIHNTFLCFLRKLDRPLGYWRALFCDLCLNLGEVVLLVAVLGNLIFILIKTLYITLVNLTIILLPNLLIPATPTVFLLIFLLIPIILLMTILLLPVPLVPALQILLALLVNFIVFKKSLRRLLVLCCIFLKRLRDFRALRGLRILQILERNRHPEYGFIQLLLPVIQVLNRGLALKDLEARFAKFHLFCLL